MNTKKIVGVDTHKKTLACYYDGKFKEFNATSGFDKIVKWAGKDAVFAVEGAYCFGQPFAAYLIKNGKEVYEVNPLLTKNWRGVLSISNPKNDYGDAKVISIYAKDAKLEKVSLETVKLKEKLTQRKGLVKQKVQITNQIKMLFNTRGEELPFNDLTTKKAIKWLQESKDTILEINGNILEEIIKGINKLEEEIKEQTPEKALKLTELAGISYITACTIYTETKGQLKSSASLANYCGVSPVDCSSGQKNRMKNNKKGNRVLNNVFYSLSIHQIRYNDKARQYYEKKLCEGKSPRRARKAVARNLVNIVFNILQN